MKINLKILDCVLHFYQSANAKWSGQSIRDVRSKCLPGGDRLEAHKLVVLRNLQRQNNTNKSFVFNTNIQKNDS